MLKLIVDNIVTEQETDSAFSNFLIRKYTAVLSFSDRRLLPQKYEGVKHQF
ncbi:hypothetical protein [Bacillus cereus]|uniref:Uncharacterized protein n=1 Tax=Bacillus cereus TaxID=1396 RepID=A0A0G8EZ33_BACCE|nr:hypothetical protein [Bacillus cereus]KLA29419.1 hypothetical protein B4077_3479 [Bacillus cereus]